MNQRPVAFNAAMVKALLAGKKSHTRRTSRIPQIAFDTDYCPHRKKWAFLVAGGKTLYRQCPYGVAGDRLWVKEHWSVPTGFDAVKPADVPVGTAVNYLASWNFAEPAPGKARPPMFMPRKFSRIQLEVVSSRCERLHAIQHEGAIAEGIEQVGMFGRFPRYRDYQGYDAEGYMDGVCSFASLWDTINGSKEGKRWIDNPWVWDIEFRVLEVRS